MTRAEQPAEQQTGPGAPSGADTGADAALTADSRERAVRALLRDQPLRRLWSAQAVSGTADALALLVLVMLAVRAAVTQEAFGPGLRGAAFAVAAAFGARALSTLLFGAVLLGPMTSFIAPGGPLDRRWTMITVDGLRVALLVVAPLWIVWTPGLALPFVLLTVFLNGAAERFWTIARESAAPALLPAPPPRAPPCGRSPTTWARCAGCHCAPPSRASRPPRPSCSPRPSPAGSSGSPWTGSRSTRPPALVRRGRPLRRVRVPGVRPAAARHADPPAPLPRWRELRRPTTGAGAERGPHGGRTAARAGLRRSRRSDRFRRVDRRAARR